jgi:hypothetical protein
MKLPKTFYLSTILLFLSSCTPELSKYCPDAETSYKAEKFKYGSRLSFKNSREKTNQLVENTQLINIKKVEVDYQILALATKTNEVNATSKIVFSENRALHLAHTYSSIPTSPVMDKSKIKVKQRQNAAKLIKRIESKQQDPDELHYKTKRRATLSTIIGIGLPVLTLIFPFFG